MWMKDEKFPSVNFGPEAKSFRAQLNGPVKQSHTDIHLNEHQSRSNESLRTRNTRANNPVLLLAPPFSCCTSPLGTRGMRAAWEGDSRQEARATTVLNPVARQGRNPSAHAGRSAPLHLPPHPPLLPPHQSHLPREGADV